MGNALAVFGKGYALISAILTTFVSLVLIGFGIYIIAKGESSKGLGWALLAFGLFALIAVWVWYYIVSKSKTVAEVSGILDVASIV